MNINNRILITGVSGYIGSCLYNYLRKKNKFVYGLDKIKPTRLSLIKKKDFFLCNLLNQKKLKKILLLVRPTVIIHLAGQSTVDPGISIKKYFIDNVKTTENLILLMKELKISKIVFSSTAAVYKEKNSSLREEDNLKPKSNYGKSKILAENLIRKNKKLKFIILRFFNVSSSLTEPLVGEHHLPETHFIPTLVSRSLKNQTTKVFGRNYNTDDGTCIRDYIHIKDVCSSIEKSIVYLFKENYKSKIINIGNEVGISNLQILEVLTRKLRCKIKVLFTRRRLGDPARLVCSIDKAKKYLNWEPHNSRIEKIIIDEISWSRHLIKQAFRRFPN